jgi:biopolymer transport protein ExbD
MSFGSKREMEQEFEINLASIVDCFTVLITYLLAAGSFISLGMIPAESLVDRAPSAETAPAAEAEVVPPVPTVTFTVEVLPEQRVRFSVWQGEVSEKKEFAAKDVADIQTYLTELKGKHPDLKNAVFASDPGVTYGEFMKAADPVRGTFKILLAGAKK